jgi:hypothetical protein
MASNRTRWTPSQIAAWRTAKQKRSREYWRTRREQRRLETRRVEPTPALGSPISIAGRLTRPPDYLPGSLACVGGAVLGTLAVLAKPVRCGNPWNTTPWGSRWVRRN